MHEDTKRHMEEYLNEDGKGTNVISARMNDGRYAIAKHGYIVKRRDDYITNCGGPPPCNHCMEEKRRWDNGTYPYDD